MRNPALAALAALLVVGTPALRAQTVYKTEATIWGDSAWNGLTIHSTKSPTEEIVCIDMEGRVVNRWVSPVAGKPLASVEPLSNSRILARMGNDTVAELDWDGNVVWSAAIPPPYRAHHDVERLPNGNTIVLVAQDILIPSISPNVLTDDGLLELDPQGQIVWQWFTRDHIGELNLSAQTLSLINAQGGDWAHTNAISALPPNNHTSPEFATGNIVVSQRNTNRVAIIDRTTDAVVWTMSVATQGQHDSHMIPQGLPGAGNILVFDNGHGTPYQMGSRGWSRVLEVDPSTQTVVWTYQASVSGNFNWLFNSGILSGAQRLPNGNTLICSGVKGRIFEVTPSGATTWEYMNPFAGPSRSGLRTVQVYRAFRVPYGFAPRDG